MDEEFPRGRCVDCGMNVPCGDVICDICKAAWQTYSYPAGRDVRRGRDTTVQSGVQKLPKQDGLQLVSLEITNDAPLRYSEEG